MTAPATRAAITSRSFALSFRQTAVNSTGRATGTRCITTARPSMENGSTTDSLAFIASTTTHPATRTTTGSSTMSGRKRIWNHRRPLTKPTQFTTSGTMSNIKSRSRCTSTPTAGACPPQAKLSKMAVPTETCPRPAVRITNSRAAGSRPRKAAHKSSPTPR